MPDQHGATITHDHGVQTSAVEVTGTNEPLGSLELVCEVILRFERAIAMGRAVVEALDHGRGGR